MELSIPQWIDFAKNVFYEEFNRTLPQANCQIVIDKHRISFDIFVGGRKDFEIISSLELLEVKYLQKFSNVTMIQYPDQDFKDSVSEILRWIAKYYDGMLELNEYKTRIFRRKFLSMKDRSSGDVLHFRNS